MAVGLPGGALAKGLPPGVHIDPGSPAGKQYQIPVASARSFAAGQKGSDSGANPPLFGVGVTPARAPAPPAAGAAAGSGSGTTAAGGSRATRGSAARRSTHRPRHRHPGPAATDGSLTPGLRATRADTSQPGGEGWLPLVAGGALVLLVAGGGGLGLRRFVQT